MKLTQISENELKIVLTRTDLSELDLTLQTIDYNTTKTRKAIWEIFDRANVQTGFDAAKSKIYVKLYPMSDGGCEMYVSRLKSGAPQKVRKMCAAKKKLRYAGKNYLFKFEDFESLAKACEAINPSGKSALYIDDDGKYILYLQNSKRTYASIERWNEFGENLKLKYTEGYLIERCELICGENVVRKISGKKRKDGKKSDDKRRKIE